MKILVKKSIRSRKRHFQLLELMVAAFLLLICISPMMRIYTTMYLTQQSMVRENQRDHLAHYMHAKITELLHQNKISLEDIKQNKSITLNDPFLNEQLHRLNYEYEGMLVLESSQSDKPKKYLGKLVIVLKDKLYKPKQNQDLKIQNQDPAKTFYDYSIYIDSGARANKGGSNKPPEPNDLKAPSMTTGEAQSSAESINSKRGVTQ